MRISARSDDPDFFGHENYGRYAFTVNGQPIDKVVWADTDKGQLCYMPVNDQGHVMRDERRPGFPVQLIRRGVVVIIDKRALAPTPAA